MKIEENTFFLSINAKVKKLKERKKMKKIGIIFPENEM